jgi:glycosyltransferase involved in cell wall biosynthesis
MGDGTRGGTPALRVAIVTSTRIVNSVYRALPLLELSDAGREVIVDDGASALTSGRLKGFDVVHVFRYHEAETRRGLRALREAGTAIVWDNDDDLADERSSLRTDAIAARVAETLRLAHVVTTTSPALADTYRRWGANEVQVIENYLPDYYAAERRGRERGAGVVIGWTAAGEHAQDLRAFDLRTTLERLLEIHPDVRVVSAGLDLRLPADRYAYTLVVQYQDLARYVGDFDIGIAPIADTAFNRAKSSVKLKEYAAMGVPWLASPIGPYAGLGEKQGGRLVPDDRWFEELDRLVRDARARRKLAKRGAKWGESQRLRHNLDRWQAALVRAGELSATQPRAA